MRVIIITAIPLIPDFEIPKTKEAIKARIQEVMEISTGV
jgi:hypothetical protein